MSSVSIQGNASGTGIFTIASPNSNTNRTLTLPDNTGTILTTASTIAGTGPAFSAYPSGSQGTISANTWTKLSLGSEFFDTANAFDSTTNFRFTPQVAGYYQIIATANSPSTTTVQIALYKNGSIYAANLISGSSGYSPLVSQLIYLNGSTDYVESYINTSSSGVFSSSSTYTYMSGYLVRAA
jgi:hypothetical protein